MDLYVANNAISPLLCNAIIHLRSLKVGIEQSHDTELQESFDSQRCV